MTAQRYSVTYTLLDDDTVHVQWARSYRQLVRVLSLLALRQGGSRLSSIEVYDCKNDERLFHEVKA